MAANRLFRTYITRLRSTIMMKNAVFMLGFIIAEGGEEDNWTEAVRGVDTQLRGGCQRGSTVLRFFYREMKRGERKEVRMEWE